MLKKEFRLKFDLSANPTILSLWAESQRPGFSKTLDSV
jgi:hypothetical protein